MLQTWSQVLFTAYKSLVKVMEWEKSVASNERLFARGVKVERAARLS